MSCEMWVTIASLEIAASLSSWLLPLSPSSQLTTTPIKDLQITTGLGKPLQVPFDFSPEFKPQDLGIEFRLIIRDEVNGFHSTCACCVACANPSYFLSGIRRQQTGKRHNVRVYTGNVTVVEPERVWDLQL